MYREFGKSLLDNNFSHTNVLLENSSTGNELNRISNSLEIN
jgi:hypothetical protein